MDQKAKAVHRWFGASNSLFIASCAALYFEVLVIRYLGSEVRVFAYLKNLSLIASFLGIGLGMILGWPKARILRAFPVLSAILFILIANASAFKLIHLPAPTLDYWQFGSGQNPISWATLVYVLAVLYFLALIVGIFVVLGGFVGESLSKLPPLKAYGINLAGSLTGILLFTALGYLYSPPWVWLLIGFVFLVPFFIESKKTLAIFGLLVIAVAVARPDAMWSPYYRVSVDKFETPAGWPRVSAYFLNVNHDYFQKILDLSPEFMKQNPTAEPNRTAFPHYELPYRLVPNPHEVLIVGAGTGNDVAAALRHNAGHIDAVEIDPLILRLGREIHPEHPYASPRVTIFNDDARAFFKKAPRKYDLIVFGYLDSHTLLTGYASVRLENYVYTKESFLEARKLLKPGGTLMLAFASGRTFLTDRLYATLAAAFGAPPTAYETGYDGGGVVFVEGAARTNKEVAGFPEISKRLQSKMSSTVLATDNWPFLFLKDRRIPASILGVLALFLVGAWMLCRRTLPLHDYSSRESLHMFFLGAGFLLLETKGITELSLLFGATWVTISVVIAAFFVMAIFANVIVAWRKTPFWFSYTGLFAVLIVTEAFSYSRLVGLPPAEKILAAGVVAALPVFFSGLVFSSSFFGTSNSSQALGINLLGAMVGGALENLVMIGGSAILGVLAVLLYACSAIVLPRAAKMSSSREPIGVNSHVASHSRG